MNAKKMIRIGNASGYWGDDPDALERQVNGGRLDYISMDFLAEITMSIMQKQRGRDPSAGYARDFVPMLEKVLDRALEQGTKIITNAGGINPAACAEAIDAMARRLGRRPKIAIVSGDDILDQLGALRRGGCAFSHMDSGADFASVEARIQAANIYFGAAPVAAALALGPDIIITGRVTDTGITIGPMVHEFGWSLDDWHKLASGVVAGHIIECGSQATGGNFTDWHLVKTFSGIGYPIVEVEADGSFTVTKHPGSGGLVSVDTVREQLFYEMGHPRAYLTPDVVADFSTIRLEATGADRVRVSGVKGQEPTPLYKVSMAYSDGYKCIGEIAISGPDARRKAEAFAATFWERAGTGFAATSTEYFGLNACHRSLGHADEANEIILRLGARDADQKKLKRLAKLVPSLILSGPPGVSILGGVPKVQEIVSYWPALMPKQAVHPLVALWREGTSTGDAVTTTRSGDFRLGDDTAIKQVATAATRSIREVLAKDSGTPLIAIALARSGDKGDSANIGVMARSEAAFAWLDTWLTAQRVKDYFQELCVGRVVRYRLDNLKGFNFLLEQSLDGGGTMSLRVDAQGKTFAQALLRQRAPIPAEVLASIKPTSDQERQP